MNWITVVLPVRNEGPWLRASLERLHTHLADLKGAYRTELIVVDDASEDSTAAVVETFRRQHPATLRFLRLSRPHGLAGALRAAAKAARSATTVVIDGKLSYPPETIERLAGEAFRIGAACVVASAYARGGRVSRMPLLVRLGDALANALLSRCVRRRVATLTGTVRTYETKVLRELLEREPQGDFNAWAIGELLAAGHVIREIPAQMSWPRAARSGRTTMRDFWRELRSVLTAAAHLRKLPPSSFVPPVGAATATAGTYGPL
jgi:glycosyltransferase involved in cell wall biosynthesis